MNAEDDPTGWALPAVLEEQASLDEAAVAAHKAALRGRGVSASTWDREATRVTT